MLPPKSDMLCDESKLRDRTLDWGAVGFEERSRVGEGGGKGGEGGRCHISGPPCYSSLYYTCVGCYLEHWRRDAGRGGWEGYLDEQTKEWEHYVGGWDVWTDICFVISKKPRAYLR